MSRIFLLAFLLPALVPPADAQPVIVYDWEARTFTSCPAAGQGLRGIQIRVENVNDILYQYSIRVNTAYSYPNPAEELASLGFRLAESGSSEPPALARPLAQRLKQKVADSPALSPKPSNGVYPSVKLQETKAAWTAIETDKDYTDLAARIPSVRNFQPDLQDLLEARQFVLAVWDLLARLKTRVSQAPNVVLASATLDPAAKNDVSLDITELYDGRKTAGSNPTAVCSIDQSAFSISVGAGVSTIAQRSYTPVAVPAIGADGAPTGGTYNALSVSGDSRLRPVLLGLFHYQIPGAAWRGGDYGLAVTFGPTLRLAGESNVSSIGGFFGLSLHLYRQLFLTPGFHLGEFSDFPFGYAEGSFVPPGVTAPAARTRTTVKFGFAISVRAGSFGDLKQVQVQGR